MDPFSFHYSGDNKMKALSNDGNNRNELKSVTCKQTLMNWAELLTLAEAPSVFRVVAVTIELVILQTVNAFAAVQTGTRGTRVHSYNNNHKKYEWWL